MKILVVGATGLLGSNVVAAADEFGHDLAGSYRTGRSQLPGELYHLDLPDPSGVRTLLDRTEPTVAVNCAAMTDVDRCESTPERAVAINASAAGDIARACADRDIPLVHVSTDYVFDGESRERYTEDTTPDPRQRYGQTKYDGERAVRAADGETYIVRPSFIWGVNRGTDELAGFPAWIRERLAAGKSTALFTDQRITPSRAWTTATTLLGLLTDARPGTYHVAARSCVTPYQFGELIRSQCNAPPQLLEEGTMASPDRAAKRPRDTCLSVEKVEAALGQRQPTLDTEVGSVFDGQLSG